MNQGNFSPHSSVNHVRTKINADSLSLSDYTNSELAGTGPRGTAGARCPSTTN